MPFVPVPNVVKIITEGNTDGIPWAFINHVKYSGSPPSTSDLMAGASVWMTSLTSKLMPHCHQSRFLTDVHLVDLSSTTGAVGDAGGSYVGSITGGTSAASSCLVVSKITARHYRGGHGRVYLPAGALTNMANSYQWQGSFALTVATDWAAHWTTCGNGGMWANCTDDCVLHYTLGHVAQVPPLADSVTAYRGNAGIGTQRGRLT